MVKTASIYLVTAIFFFAALFYVADFPLRQSIVVAILITSLSRGLKKIATRSGTSFTPFYVHIAPKWFPLLADFKLISSEEEWWVLSKYFEASPTLEQRMLRWGVFFTVVQQSEYSENTLFYLNHRRSFASKIDYHVQIEGLKMDSDASEGYKRGWSPEIFVERKPDGYALGLRVPDWWWEKMKQSCPTPRKEEKDDTCGRVELTLTSVPYKEFDLYVESADWNDDSPAKNEKDVKQMIAERDEQRAKFGWKSVARRNESGRRIGWPEAIEHKYFEVEHNGI
jgi:hypothetical protein